jgi:cytochrome c-type biogenesis protein CcmE
MKAKFIIGGIIVIVFAIWGASAFLQTTVKYVSFDEARQADRTVQIVGGINFSSVIYDSEKNRLVFNIYDLETPEAHVPDQIEIIYYGVVPGNFEQATSVLVRGKPGSEGFVAEQLLVKCPSKYQGTEENI